MSLDLLTFDAGQPDLAWMYAHATLQRLFRPIDDGRSQFFSQVPGLKSYLTRAQLSANANPSLDLILDHYLLEFEDGWLNILGGTKVGGWVFHSFSLVEFPLLENAYFCQYWWTLATRCWEDIGIAIAPEDKRKIMFSGHSLGGATSTTCAYQGKLADPARKVEVITFGAPLTRAKSGMEDRDFPCCRIGNQNDLVTALPQNMVRVPWILIPVKAGVAGLYHYGTPVFLLERGGVQFVDPHSLRYSIVGLGLATFGSLNGRWDPFNPHYVVSYALRLRQELLREGITPPWFYDEVNAYLNNAEGITWNVAGFPAAAPPPLPDVFTPPTPSMDWNEETDTTERFSPLLANLLAPIPTVPVIPDQSLAAFLRDVTGRNFTDVSVHLASAPIPDPENVDVDSFTECTFSGYQEVRGKFWVTTPPPDWTNNRRFQGRAVFICLGGEQEETVYHTYTVGEIDNGVTKVLLDWTTFAQPYTVNRRQGIALEISVPGGIPVS